MFQMKPISPELLEFYRTRHSEIQRVSDALGHLRFSSLLRRELERELKTREAVSLLETVARLGGYHDHREHARSRAAVSRLLRRDGYRQPRGKRPAPELVEFVEDVAPLLLYFGVPPATGEGAKLVTLLRRIAAELSVRGDPRDELRRANRRLREQRETTMRVIHEAVIRGLEPLRRVGSQPPPNISLSDDPN